MNTVVDKNQSYVRVLYLPNQTLRPQEMSVLYVYLIVTKYDAERHRVDHKFDKQDHL